MKKLTLFLTIVLITSLSAISQDNKDSEPMKPALLVIDIQKAYIDMMDDEGKEQAIYYTNALIELSGGINLDNVNEYSLLGADVISMGYLTHSVKGIDFSMARKSAGSFFLSGSFVSEYFVQTFLNTALVKFAAPLPSSALTIFTAVLTAAETGILSMNII